MTTKNLETDEDAKVSGDSGSERRGKNFDEEKLANEIQKNQEYANVWIKAGEYEVSMETSKDLETTTDHAIRALAKAKAMDDIEGMPTKGVQ